MSDLYRTKEEYAERHAQTYNVSVEQAKQTAVYGNFAAYVDDRVREMEKRENKD